MRRTFGWFARRYDTGRSPEPLHLRGSSDSYTSVDGAGGDPVPSRNGRIGPSTGATACMVRGSGRPSIPSKEGEQAGRVPVLRGNALEVVVRPGQHQFSGIEHGLDQLRAGAVMYAQ